MVRNPDHRKSVPYLSPNVTRDHTFSAHLSISGTFGKMYLCVWLEVLSRRTAHSLLFGLGIDPGILALRICTRNALISQLA